MSKYMSFAKTALKNLFSEPATTSYPFEPREYPERTRGHIEIAINDCIFCGMCMRNCPPRAITVDRATSTWKINGYDCVQCGYCTEVCPKKCLKIVPGYTTPAQTKEEASFTKEVEQTEKTAAKTDGKTDGKSVPKADLDKCVYCTLCAKKCPEEAITVDRAEKVWKVDEEACIGCGLCETNCPKKCITMENK